MSQGLDSHLPDRHRSDRHRNDDHRKHSQRKHGDDRFYDPDMRLPPALLHFFPIVLALFTLTMSVAGHSIFFGFDEDEPITWMSLTLMLAVLAMLLAVIRDHALTDFERLAAMVLSLVTGFAILDEQLRWHEKVGKYVKNELEFFTRDIRHYTDDAIIVVFALLGAALFYVFVRKLPKPRDVVPYVVCVVALALAHGVLDVLGHGGRLWRALIPEITKHQVDLLTETLGFFEEACKLWAEWFVLLFVLRVFHRQQSPLGWSILVMAGSFLSGIGLWAIEDPSTGIPYVVMEKTLRLLRNYHLLILLSAIFVAWGLASWRLFRDQPKKQALAGLFFLTPFYAVLPEITRAATSLSDGFGLFALSTGGFVGQPYRLLAIGGPLLPMAVVFLIAQRPKPQRTALIIAVTLAAMLIQSPVWLLLAFAILLAMAIEQRPASLSKKAWTVIVVAQLLVIAAVYPSSWSGILPEYRFDVPEKVVFETGLQTIDPNYYGSVEKESSE